MNFTSGIDFLHALDAMGLLTRPLAVEMAVVCAEHVFGNVPEENQNGCQKAINAANDWLAAPSKQNRRRAKRAAAATLPGTYVPAAWGASYAARTAAELVFKYEPYIMASALEAARLGDDPISEGKWQAWKIIEVLDKNGIDTARMMSDFLSDFRSLQRSP